MTEKEAGSSALEPQQLDAGLARNADADGGRTPLTSLRGIGPKRLLVLEGFGVDTVEKLAALSDDHVAEMRHSMPAARALRESARRALR